MNSLFHELILITIKKQDSFSRTPIEKEWTSIYVEAERRVLIGFVFAGIERLSSRQRPVKSLLMDWLGQVEYIRSQNMHVTETVGKVNKLFYDLSMQIVLCTMDQGWLTLGQVKILTKTKRLLKNRWKYEIVYDENLLDSFVCKARNLWNINSEDQL